MGTRTVMPSGLRVRSNHSSPPKVGRSVAPLTLIAAARAPRAAAEEEIGRRLGVGAEAAIGWCTSRRCRKQRSPGIAPR